MAIKMSEVALNMTFIKNTAIGNHIWICFIYISSCVRAMQHSAMYVHLARSKVGLYSCFMYVLFGVKMYDLV